MSQGIAAAHPVATTSTWRLKRLYVRAIAVASGGIVVGGLYASTIIDSRTLQVWTMVGAVTSGAAFVQLRLRQPSPRALVTIVAVGSIPAAYYSEGGEIPAIVATLSLVGTAVTLLDSDERGARNHLGLLMVSILLISVVHHIHLEGRLALDPATATGAALVVIAFVITYLHIIAVRRAADYEEALHRALFDTAADAVLIVDEAGTVERANPAAGILFGWTPAELIGSSITRLIPPELRKRYDENIADFMKTGGRAAMTERRVLSALKAWGETFPVEISISLLDVGGRRVAAAVVRDVTRRVHAEEDAAAGLHAYRALYEAMPIGLYRTTGAGVILEANAALLDLIGARSQEEARAVNVTDLYVDPSKRGGFLEEAAADASIAEFQLRKLTGETIWVRDHTTATVGVESGMMINEGAMEDITEQVHAIEMLQAAADQRQRLIDSLAHTLRTPLTVVVGFADQLAAGAGESGEATELARIIGNHARTLAAAIDEVFLLNRLMSGDEPVELADVQLGAVLRSSIDAIPVHQSDIDIQAPDGSLPVVHADEQRLERALTRVFAHAARTDTVPLEVGVETGTTGSVRIRVPHQCSAPATDEEVFEPFAEAGPMAVAADSPGFGLWSARELIRLMDGDLTHTAHDGRCDLVVEVPGTAEVRRPGAGPSSPPEAAPSEAA